MYNDFFDDPSRKRMPKNQEENDDSNLSDENDEDAHFKKRSKRKPENSNEANNSKKVRYKHILLFLILNWTLMKANQ